MTIKLRTHEEYRQATSQQIYEDFLKMWKEGTYNTLWLSFTSENFSRTWQFESREIREITYG